MRWLGFYWANALWVPLVDGVVFRRIDRRRARLSQGVLVRTMSSILARRRAVGPVNSSRIMASWCGHFDAMAHGASRQQAGRGPAGTRAAQHCLTDPSALTVARDAATLPRPSPARLDAGVLHPLRGYLKEVIAVGAVELARQHAAMLETGVRSCRGTGRCDRVASRAALCPHSQLAARV